MRRRRGLSPWLDGEVILAVHIGLPWHCICICVEMYWFSVFRFVLCDIYVQPKWSTTSTDLVHWCAVLRDEFHQKKIARRQFVYSIEGSFSNDQDILHPQKASHLKDDQKIVSRQSMPTEDVQQLADATFAWLMIRRETDIRDLTMCSSTSPLLVHW